MHFDTKNYLKSIQNHTTKHASKQISDSYFLSPVNNTKGNYSVE